jgi:hypothetical protein
MLWLNPVIAFKLRVIYFPIHLYQFVYPDWFLDCGEIKDILTW